MSIFAPRKRKMQPSIDIKPSCDAMKTHGMKGAFFCTFSSKKATAHFSLNNYTQSISGEFSCCSFTGKERDEETGYGYFSARYMDHELLTSFISVDRYASKYPSISSYAYCAWNPIAIIDPKGDSLFALDRLSQVVLMNLTGPYRKRILFDSRGAASIDYSGLSENEKKDMESNAEVKLLKDIIDSPQKILFELSDLFLCTDKNGNKKSGYLAKKDENGVMNASRGGLDAWDDYTFLPREGFDGQVVVSEYGSWSSGGFTVSMSEIITHELAENYARTVHKCNYKPNPEGDTEMAKLGAHEYANRRMNNPHKAYTFKYNRVNNPKYKIRLNEYYGY